MWLVATDVFWNGRVFCSSAQYFPRRILLCFVGCREVQISCAESICERRRALILAAVLKFADVREGTFFFLVGGRAGVSEGGSSVKVSSKRGGSYLFVSYLRGGSHTFSKFFNEDFCDIALHFSYRLRRLERVFRCTRARNLHQDAHVI